MVRGSQLRVAELELTINSTDLTHYYPLVENDAPTGHRFSAPVCFFDVTAMTSRCTVLFNQILGMTLFSIPW